MIRRILEALGLSRLKSTPTVTVTWDGNDNLLAQTRDRGMHAPLDALTRTSGGRRVGFFSKQWHMPLDAFATLQTLPADLKIAPEHREPLERYALSGALNWDSASHVSDDFGVRLYPFQEAATAYLLRARRCVLGDEAGVGKTFAAIAAAAKVREGSAIVVCPANLKLNWLSEIKRARPVDSTHVCKGRTPEQIPTADWIILNYDIATTWADSLRQVRSNVVIFDEIHNCKNPGAKRSQACLEIAQEREYRFGLTGTLFRNRHSEAFFPLRVIGQIDALGGQAALLQRYCGGQEGRSINPVGFNRRLRTQCYARREKRAVLSMLPAKTRSNLTVELPSDGDYERAEKGLIAWLRSVRGDKARWKNERMNALAQINQLRMKVGQAKTGPAIEWIKDFLDQSTEKLVVFGYHRSVNATLAKAFPTALHIFSEDSLEDRQATKESFQADPNHRLILCALGVASEGITLTAATTLLCLELDYVPARLFDQMEGRVDRNGQTKPTQMYYMVADGSLDQRMIRLLEAKWHLVTAANTGQATQADGSIFDELVDDFLA